MIRPVLFLLLILSVLVASPETGRAQSDQDLFKVAFLTWRGCEESCEGFARYLQNEGINAEITHLDAAQDRERIPSLVAAAKALRPDLVVTWGNTVTLGAVGTVETVDPMRHITDIPVVYMYVTQAVSSGLAASDHSTGRANVAGTDYVVPVANQLRAIQAYRPFTRLGMLYDTTQEGSVKRKELIERLAAEQGFELHAEPIPLLDGRPDLISLPGLVRDMGKKHQVEFLYFGYSSFLVRNLQFFTQLAVLNDLPVFTGGQKPVVEGDALIGVFSRLDHIGQLAGFQAKRILINREAPADMPIARFNRYTMMINMRVAEALNFFPPLTMIRYADFVE